MQGDLATRSKAFPIPYTYTHTCYFIFRFENSSETPDINKRQVQASLFSWKIVEIYMNKSANTQLRVHSFPEKHAQYGSKTIFLLLFSLFFAAVAVAIFISTSLATPYSHLNM